MASQSTGPPASGTAETPADTGRLEQYLAGWVAMTELMHQGKSWSGRERNCCYLNPGPDRTLPFIEVSAVAGLDFPDDGRSVAVTDWDGDGDLDLWFKNRTGPQLRLMINQGSPGTHYIAFKLTGRSCNRDAIGAKVELRLSDRSLVRSVRAGDGYLAQSSKWVHFGLGASDRVEQVTVTWPGGATQVFTAPAVDHRYRMVQDAPELERVHQRNITINESPAKPASQDALVRMVLKEPLPLPASLLAELFGSESGQRARLVSLWAHWCVPCLVELGRFATDRDRLAEAGLDLLALNIDSPADRSRAKALYDKEIAARMPERPFREMHATAEALDVLAAILEQVRDKPDPNFPLPASLLIDGDGALQVVYLGPVSLDTLLVDVADYAINKRPEHRRMSFPGRWYFRTPRDFGGLIRELDSRNRTSEADFYRELQQQRKARNRGLGSP